MTHSVPWQQRLSSGTEDIQDEVIRWYQQTRHGKGYVPTMIWGTLQTEAYATVILRRVVEFLEVPDDVPAGVVKRMERQQVLYDGEHHYDVILGEQALYTNIGGPEVMREQMERLLRDIDLSSLSLGVLGPVSWIMHSPSGRCRCLFGNAMEPYNTRSLCRHVSSGGPSPICGP
ncbi:Scr1 family TA system antitoxin-like transcriptional regulator [Streptomyces mirabilis]|uniref:Scr1 family TA system antitoxin-like transcriptional regulator n=1 Tax=Streptomyces mirabilis TaxID=68239 RepID=UPI0036BF934F